MPSKKDCQWASMALYRHRDVELGRKSESKVTPSTISACHPLRKIFCLPANIWLKQITCDPSVPRYWWWSHQRAFWAATPPKNWTFLGRLLVSQDAANIAQRHADAKWSAAAGRPTSPHLNRDSSPVRFSAVSNGHFRIFPSFTSHGMSLPTNSRMGHVERLLNWNIWKFSRV